MSKSNYSLFQHLERFKTEKQCQEYLKNKKWPNGPECPNCKSKQDIYFLKNQNRYKCKKCKRQFSLLSETIFHSTKIPLTQWFILIYLMTTSKSGESSYKMSSILGIQQRTVWTMMKKVRTAMKPKGKKLLNGIVEVDEVFISPKPQKDNRLMLKKTLYTIEQKKLNEEYVKFNQRVGIFGAVERGGLIRVEVLGRGLGCETKEAIEEKLLKFIDKEAIIMSDMHSSYSGVSKLFKEHKSIGHGKRKYVNGIVHTNNIENAWLHLQRLIKGTHIHVSYQYLQSYLDEFAFRWNGRKTNQFDLFDNFFINLKIVSRAKTVLRDI